MPLQAKPLKPNKVVMAREQCQAPTSSMWPTVSTNKMSMGPGAPGAVVARPVR